MGALFLAELAKFIENKKRKKRWWTGESSSDAYAHDKTKFQVNSSLDLHHVTNTGKNFEIWTEGRSRGKLFSFPLVFSRFCLQKSVMHVQSCCFANQSKPEAVICFCLNLLLFCRSRCRHRRHCLTLITPTPPTKHRVKKKKRFECGQCCLHHGGVRLLFHSYHLFLKSLFITAYNRRQRPLLIFQTTHSGTHDLQKISCYISIHSASRFNFNFMSDEPTQRNIFFLFCV